MGYYDYDGESEAGARPEGTRGVLGAMQAVLGICVRLLGLGLILIGLAIGVSVVLEAWALYKTPERIERFAVAIEQGSNIDSSFRSVAQAAAAEVTTEDGQANSEAGARRPNNGGFRLSYFAAWAITLVLMLVVGSLAMSAVATGAKLSLPGLSRR